MQTHRLVAAVSVVGTMLLAYTAAYTTGKVESACNTMLPKHMGLNPQDSLAPYTLSGTQNADGSITVNIESASDGDVFFRGFLLQARNSSNQRVGVFSGQPDVAQLLTCDYPGSAVSHNFNESKESVTVLWRPQDYEGDVTFRATIVREFDTFWVGLTSQTFSEVYSAIIKPPAA